MGNIRTVTNGKWGVSYTTGSDIDGCILNIYQHHDAPDKRAAGIAPYFRTQRGDHDGRRFPTVEAAKEFALEHGYLRPYYPKARLCGCRGYR